MGGCEMTLSQRLNQVFQHVFNDDSIQLTEKTSTSDVEGWDSVRQINLMLSIEHEFGVQFATHELTGFNSIGELIELIKCKGVA